MAQKNKLSDVIVEKDFETIRGFMGNKKTYLSSEVDDFLQKMAEEVGRLEKENQALRHQVELMKSEKNFTSEFSNKTEEELMKKEKEVKEKEKKVHRMEVTLGRMLLMAQEQADQITEEAKLDAEAVRNKYKAEGEVLLEEARKKHADAIAQADAILAEAKKKRETILKRYEEVKNEFFGIYQYIGEAILKEDNVDTTYFAEKTKKVVGEN